MSITKPIQVLVWPFKKWWSFGKKRWLILPVLLGIGIINSMIQTQLNAGKPDLKRYEWVKVEARTIKKKISREGKLYQRGLVPVVQPVSGMVKQAGYKNGDTVKKGVVIARIESTSTPEQKAVAWQKYTAAKLAVADAEAGKLTAQASLETARKQLLDATQTVNNMTARFNEGNHQNETANRPNKEYTDNEIESIKSVKTTAEKNFAAAENTYQHIDESITTAQAGLSAAWWAYQSTQTAQIVAPVDGMIQNMAAGPGEYIELAENQPFVQIVTNPAWITKLVLSEREVTLIKPGLDVLATMITNPEIKFNGTVERVDAIATVKENETTYAMVATLDATQSSAINGARVTTDIKLAERQANVSIPNGAVRYRDGKRYVQLNQNGKTTEKQVEVGIADESYTEILSGLTAGDLVLAPRLRK